MNSFSGFLQQGAAHAWLFIPSAVVLGALHGLEPGHSKTMMAAFIIAVRGTTAQAVMLGLAAAFSHSLLVWAIAAAGLYYGGKINAEATEPYFQLVSGVIVAGMAIWMFFRTRGDVRAAQGHSHGHDHHHDHGHPHDHSHHHHHDVPGHEHDEEVLKAVAGEYQDAHEKMHAEEIEQRFAGRQVSTGQIILFGLAGGLLPCPAAVTVLLICLQLKEFVLGFAMVLAFSFGLAVTMVATGVLAAWSVRHAEKRFSGFGDMVRKLPYISVVILLILSLAMGLQAWHHLAKG